MSRRLPRFVPVLATRLWLAGAVGVVCISLVPAADASASRELVRCGDTITRDTRLTNDLVNCPDNGIVIGAAGITLDLNGHTVDGDGLGDAHDLGIDNTAGHDGVTIKGGSVREFVDGVLIEGASENRVRDLSTSHQEHAGIGVAESTGVRVERNSSVADGVGIFVAVSRDVRVERNSVADNRFGAIPITASKYVQIVGNSVSRSKNGSGIGLLDDSDHNRVERNSISDGADGIFLGEGAEHNVVTGNSVARSTFQGIFLGAGADHNVVSKNSSFENIDGVVLDRANHNLVSKNSLFENALTGVFLFSSDENVIAENSVVGNSRGSDVEEGGIRLLTDAEEPGSTSDGNVISKNTITGNVWDGILVDAENRENVVQGNHSSKNGDDGIDVDSAATTLTRNTANHNHDLGIEAVPGVTDGGQNKASRNGNPLQCINVFCR